MRITTIILSYRRAILIAVYTHLLCTSTPYRPSEPGRISLRASTGCAYVICPAVSAPDVHKNLANG